MDFINRIDVSLVTLALAGAFACSSDKTRPQTAECGSSSSLTRCGHPDASTTNEGGSTAPDASRCTITLAPSTNDLETVQSALDGTVKSGDTVCFAKGTYKFTKNHLALSGAQNVTFLGLGATRDDVLFDFTGQTVGKEGVLVTTDGFTVENLSIKNTAGNGITVQANDSTFRGIKVYWENSGTRGPDGGATTGAYAIYPVKAINTLMEDNEVYGAADAGIYAGQCQHVIARRNKSHGNVLGIEIENTIGADVYDNDVYDNTTGFLLDLLPGLDQRVATGYRVHDNKIHDNNRANFAEVDTLAGVAPDGTGVLVLASSNVEITKNTIADNKGVPVIIVSYDIIDILSSINGGQASTPDQNTNRYPDHIYVHDNTYSRNGTNPGGAYALLGFTDGGVPSIPYDVLWDGILDPKGYGDAGVSSVAAASICLGTPEQQSFVDFHADTSLTKPSGYTTDIAGHQCTVVVPPLTP